SYISPWILKYSDTVWANGVDCVVGVNPAPDYRESHTNAREFVIFQSLDQVWLPQDAVHYFDIVHVDAREGFPNHAAMAFGRGRFFHSTYINPKLMTADDWRIYAGLLKWARRNADLLRHTTVVPSRVELGEPYMYAHWLGRRGIVVVRNPSNENRRFVLDLGTAGAPGDLTGGICYTQYPYRKGIATDVTGRSQLPLELAPWELLFLEIVPRSELQETVVVGGRWYRSGERTISIAPDAGVESVRVIEPRAEDRTVRVAAPRRPAPAGELVSCAVTPLPESEWLTAKPRTVAVFPFRYPAELDGKSVEVLKESGWKDVKWKPVPSVRFELKCSVSIPPQATPGQVLLLVEYPGREHRPSRCAAEIDGIPLRVEDRRSDEHIGFFNWTGNLRAAESEWTWYIGNVPPGSHRIKFSGAAGHPNPRLALWVWADHQLADEQQITSSFCSDPAMPPYRERIERHGTCIMRPAALRG
ncbi:MAG: hypothetical protein Q7S40_04555, partial [Opitutaceae bacterium]|nr:hypothetical protein [Opitutaceae bacterium]